MSDPDSKLEAGTVLDERYELADEIARGGFGRVYRARQLNMNREVAIKVVPPKFMDLPDVVERFEREARLASRLNHPNTVTVHDYGQYEDYLFLVMELLEGEDLADVLARDRSVSLDRIAHIGRQVLKSLHEAHQHNIVHRDLKPENIFLTEISGEEDFVKVVDFGIAKLAMSDMEPDRDTAKSLTVEGNTVGTPTYMSPEQAAGGDVDARSDLYALGVIMYEMAAGTPPFDDEDPAKLMRKHIFAEVPDFPDEALRGCWLEPIVQRAMAKEKEDRYQDAAAFLDAIDYALEASNDDRAFAPTQEQAAVDATDEGLAEESLEIVSPNESGPQSFADPGSSAYETPSEGPDFGAPSDRPAIRAPSEDGNTVSSIMTVLEPSPDEDVIVLDEPKEAPEPREDSESELDGAHEGSQKGARSGAAPENERTDTARQFGATPIEEPSDADRSSNTSASHRSPDESERKSWEWSGEFETSDTTLADESGRLEVDDNPESIRSGIALLVVLLGAAATGALLYFGGFLT